MPVNPNDLAHEAAIAIVGHFETGPYKRRPKHTAELERAEQAIRKAIDAATSDLRHGCLAALGYIRGASLMNREQITAEILEIVTPYVVNLPDGRSGTKPIEESPVDLAVRERSPYSFAPPWPKDPRGDFAGNCSKCGGELFHRVGHPGEYDHECAEVCRGCGQPLVEDDCWMYDGCKCNSPAGVNAGNQIISNWRMNRLNRQVNAINELKAERDRLDAACQRLVDENVKLKEWNDRLNKQVNLLSEIANEGE